MSIRTIEEKEAGPDSEKGVGIGEKGLRVKRPCFILS